MDERDVRAWFDEYLTAFAAAGRGELPPKDVVGFYAAPLLLTTEDVVARLVSSDEVAAWLQTQVDGMRAAGYDRSETLSSEVRVLNSTTALHRAEFSRRRADGGEINAFAVTYVITRGADGLRISALVLHSP